MRARRRAPALLLALAASLPPVPALADFAEGFAAFQAEDYAGAWTLLAPEAEAGDRRAQFLLGEMLLKGLGREADTFAAAGWFQKAVREPDPDRYALYALASQYFIGDGVPKDVANAIVLYERAASLGDLEAMRSLAAIHARGEEVPQDLQAALRWLFLAAQSGDPAAVERFSRLAGVAGRSPPVSGSFVAIAYVAPADHPSWSASPGFLPGIVGSRLTLGDRSFALGDTACTRPAFVSGTVDAADLSAAMAGVVPYGVVAADDPTPLTTVAVTCDGTLAASIAVLGDGRLMLSALGGALLFESTPSPTVAEAQRLLAQLGYQPGPVDGVYGPRTGAALQAFQADSGVLATGAFDAATLFALSARAAGDAPPPPDGE